MNVVPGIGSAQCTWAPMSLGTPHGQGPANGHGCAVDVVRVEKRVGRLFDGNAARSCSGVTPAEGCKDERVVSGALFPAIVTTIRHR